MGDSYKPVIRGENFGEGPKSLRQPRESIPTKREGTGPNIVLLYPV